jgi:hypothetical protein
MQIADTQADEVKDALFAIEMNIQDQDFHAEWQRCSMLANYIAAYVAYQFTQYGRAENLISTVANELFETITHLSPGESHLSIRCIQLPEKIRLDVDFSIRDEVVSAYTEFMEKLSTNESQYLRLLTSDLKPDENFNQLGLAMLVHDFNVDLRMNLDAEKRSVQTQVFIPTQEFVL